MFSFYYRTQYGPRENESLYPGFPYRLYERTRFSSCSSFSRNLEKPSRVRVQPTANSIQYGNFEISTPPCILYDSVGLSNTLSCPPKHSPISPVLKISPPPPTFSYLDNAERKSGILQAPTFEKVYGNHVYKLSSHVHTGSFTTFWIK